MKILAFAIAAVEIALMGLESAARMRTRIRCTSEMKVSSRSEGTRPPHHTRHSKTL